MAYLAKKNCRLVVLGSGEAQYEAAHLASAAAHPGHIAVHIGVDEELSHLVFAGADFFLMPSHTEPCGLTQMYAQVYGTVPLASRVGGLLDTVRDIAEHDGKGTGIMFRPEQNDFVSALGRALKLYANQATYAAVQRCAMQQDFSWASVVGQYERLYQE
jgi:starch synthase